MEKTDQPHTTCLLLLCNPITSCQQICLQNFFVSLPAYDLTMPTKITVKSVKYVIVGHACMHRKWVWSASGHYGLVISSSATLLRVTLNLLTGGPILSVLALPPPSSLKSSSSSFSFAFFFPSSFSSFSFSFLKFRRDSLLACCVLKVCADFSGEATTVECPRLRICC